MTTIKDIARISGYSIGTVSRVINNHPDVSEKARQIIMEVVERENFYPNANAKLLKQNKSSSIVIIVKGFNNFFLESVLERIQSRLNENKEEANVIFLDESNNEINEAIHLCQMNNPKGLIFIGGNLEYFRESFDRIEVPAVLACATAADLGFDNLSSFATDDYAGGRAAMELLVSHNHKHVGILGGFETVEKEQVSSLRLKGALDVLKENHISFSYKKQYIQCRMTMDNGKKAVEQLLKKNPETTAVFAMSDTVAIGAMRGIYEMGYKVPEDISIIGYDGIEITQYMSTRIATIAQDIYQIADQSVEDLLMRIHYPKKAVHELVPFTVIDKESIAFTG